MYYLQGDRHNVKQPASIAAVCIRYFQVLVPTLVRCVMNLFFSVLLRIMRGNNDVHLYN